MYTQYKFFSQELDPPILGQIHKTFEGVRLLICVCVWVSAYGMQDFWNPTNVDNNTCSVIEI